MGIILIIGYIATIPAANFLITHIGTVCVPQGPCLIPVFPGIMAPSGVLMIGAALLLRDLVQRRYGAAWALVCVGVGAGLSFVIAPPALALASGVAFLFSELVDFTAYTPLARKRFYTALIVSCAAGAVADSALFLWLAFGSLDHMLGQVIGKVYAVVTYAVGARLARQFVVHL
jgi:uncharacterized PurR-regulated membrane protein YhhQ (DUF165 family)